MSYETGDLVRVDIPNVDDPDHRYPGAVGTVEEVMQDDLSGITDNPRDDYLYRVEFEDPALGRMSFRHHDLRRVK